MEEIKPVFVEKHHSEKRDEYLFNNNFLKIFDYQGFVANIKIIGFSIENSSTGVKLSFDILIDDLKPVVAEKGQNE